MKIYYNKRDILLVISIVIFTSYLFQIYWEEVVIIDSVVYIEAGRGQRLFQKLLGIILLCIALNKSFSIRSFTNNFAIKIPLLYYKATVTFLIPVFLSDGYLHTAAHLMAVNFVLFAPLLFLNFNGVNGDAIFSKLIKIIVWVVCLQLLIDLIIQLFNFHLVETILGGMGNANTFGLHLIIAALGLRFIYRQHLFSNIILLMTWGTGSLICTLVAMLLFLQSIFINIFKMKISFVFIFLFILITFTFWGEIIFSSYFFDDFNAVQHASRKIVGFVTGDAFEVSSVKVRIEWMIDGLQLMAENPFSFIFGHPNFMPFWTGDGFYLTLLVTLGLPILLLFLISHIYLLYRNRINKTPLSQFASYTLTVYLIFFCTNRILDYWPSGFMYLIVFSYLCNKKIYTNN